MGIAGWIILAILIVILLLAFIIRAFVSGQIWTFLKFVILTSIIIVIYYYVAINLQAFYLSLLPSAPKNKNMVVWDNIWYAIFAVFAISICTVFIKSLKRNTLQYQMIMNSIGSLVILLLYSVMYGLYLYNDYIYKITGILTAVVFVSTLIVLICQYYGLSNMVVNSFLILYAFLMITFFMALLFVIFDVLYNVYDFLV